MATKRTSTKRPPASVAKSRPAPKKTSRPKSSERTNGVKGSGSGRLVGHCKFFPKGQLVPVSLTLQLDASLQGGSELGRQQLNRPALLIHAQDPSFACCWFSRAIDLGDESGNPAYWMLQKTAIDTWSLCLRRVSGEMAVYHSNSKNGRFPIKFKKGRTTRDFKWPAHITISHGD
jgi:hypothetical protein